MLRALMEPCAACQRGPCTLQVWSFTGLLPASVLLGCLPHLCSVKGEDGRATYSGLERHTVASEAMKGRKDGGNVQGQSNLLQSVSRLHLPTSLYHSPTPILPLSLGCREAELNDLLSSMSFSFLQMENRIEFLAHLLPPKRTASCSP